MAEITLEAQPRPGTGSSDSRRLRRQGRVPAVVYGQGVDAAPVSVDARELRQALSGDSGVNQLLSLSVDGQAHLALARSLQRHPVRHTVVHVDFLVVRRDEVISAEVPVVLVGEARLVHQADGIVEHPVTAITVRSVPSSIPSAVEVDISELGVGETIRVRDLPLPAGVTTDADPEEAVVVATVSRVAEVAEPGAEEGEGPAVPTPVAGAAGAAGETAAAADTEA